MILKTIKEFCQNANELTLSLNGKFLRQFKNNEDTSYFNKDILNEISLTTTDIHRSIICTNGDLVFVLDIDYHSHTIEESLSLSLKDAKNIEKKFPNMFLWNYTGGGIHGLAIIKYSKQNEKLIQRYGYVFDFYKSIIHHINTAVCLDMERTYVHYRGLTRCLGSFHTKHQLYSIPIDLDWEESKILEYAKKGTIVDWKIPDLKVTELVKVVQVVSSTSFQRSNSYNKATKIDIDYDCYPPCIKKLFNLKDKGNTTRFEIIRYLFALHPKSQVREFLKIILTNNEYNHGNNEGQINFILNRNYPPPSCRRLMEMGLCTHCGRAHPTVLQKKKENE